MLNTNRSKLFFMFQLRQRSIFLLDLPCYFILSLLSVIHHSHFLLVPKKGRTIELLFLYNIESNLVNLEGENQNKCLPDNLVLTEYENTFFYIANGSPIPIEQRTMISNNHTPRRIRTAMIHSSSRPFIFFYLVWFG